jgi:hypothetical protein
MTDWRLQNQDRYLKGVTLSKSAYRPRDANWDHDHCEFCWAKFSASSDDLHEGWITTDNRWICERCFLDFHQEFEWVFDP